MCFPPQRIYNNINKPKKDLYNNINPKNKKEFREPL